MRIRYQFELIQAIRNFFHQEGFIDVLTPPIVENPGMETHIHPFQLFHSNENKRSSSYLHTSPEFYMKKLLSDKSEDLNNIFTISYCFRDEPESEIHRSQFLMLEWYRKNKDYNIIKDDIEALIKYCFEYLNSKFPTKMKKQISKFERTTVSELFENFINIKILDFLDANELKNLIKKDFKDVPLPTSDCEWDDYFFLLFLNKIEPHFKNHPYLLVDKFPAPLSALSTLSKEDSRTCDRFEVYLSGVELCNCFNEITDKEELSKRFHLQKQMKTQLYNYDLPWPTEFMQTMENYPPSAGIALGVERLLMSLIKTHNPFFT